MNASETPPIPNLHDEIAAALEWWREAGADLEFTDDATAWLHDAEAPPEQQAPQNPQTQARSALLERENADPADAKSAPERTDFFAEGKAQTLDAFREFWLSAPGLDAIGPRGRVAPRGEADADLMVLVVDPEENDRDRLLSGPRGKLVERILAATGTPVENVYFASALPRHTPMADTAALAAAGLDEVLLHHVALVNPRKILAFGAQLTPFIAEQTSGPQTSLRSINYKAALPPTLAGEGLDSLAETPALKARFWRRWMEWSADK